MAFIRLGLAGTKCGSSKPRHRLCAETCLPPTYWATDARSVREVATFKSARAGAVASSPSVTSDSCRISDFMDSSYVVCDEFSIRVSRVVPDRVTHLDHEPVVTGFGPAAGVRLGMAVLEPHEREFRGRPGDVGGNPIDLAGNRIARAVDQEVREALARLLAANTHPPDLRQPVLERRIAAVLLAGVRPAGGRALLEVFALEDPAAPVRVLRRHVADRHVRALAPMPVAICPQSP